MKRLLLVILFISAFVMAPNTLAKGLEPSVFNNLRDDISSRALDELLKPSMVLVIVINESKDEQYQGSGFIVGDSYVMTSGTLLNKLQGNDKGRIIVANEFLGVMDATVQKIERIRGKDHHIVDIGLLRLKNTENIKLNPLLFNLSDAKNFMVYAWGYPRSSPRKKDPYVCFKKDTCTSLPQVIKNTGSINSIIIAGSLSSRETLKKPIITHGAPLDSGFFGGPLINYSGEVVGMNFEKITSVADNVSFSLAQPSSALVEFLIKNGVEPQLSDGSVLNVDKANVSKNPNVDSPSASVNSTPPKKPKATEAINPNVRARNMRNLGNFEIEVPKDWSIVLEEPDSILLSNATNLTSIGVFVSENHGMALKEIANVYSLAADGREAVKFETEDVYSFPYNSLGKAARGFVFDYPYNRGLHFVIYVEGDLSDPGIDLALGSIGNFRKVSKK